MREITVILRVQVPVAIKFTPDGRYLSCAALYVRHVLEVRGLLVDHDGALYVSSTLKTAGVATSDGGKR